MQWRSRYPTLHHLPYRLPGWHSVRKPSPNLTRQARRSPAPMGCIPNRELRRRNSVREHPRHAQNSAPGGRIERRSSTPPTYEGRAGSIPIAARSMDVLLPQREPDDPIRQLGRQLCVSSRSQRRRQLRHIETDDSSGLSHRRQQLRHFVPVQPAWLRRPHR
jgi:hypothetical protein